MTESFFSKEQKMWLIAALNIWTAIQILEHTHTTTPKIIESKHNRTYKALHEIIMSVIYNDDDITAAEEATLKIIRNARTPKSEFTATHILYNISKTIILDYYPEDTPLKKYIYFVGLLNSPTEDQLTCIRKIIYLLVHADESIYYPSDGKAHQEEARALIDIIFKASNI